MINSDIKTTITFNAEDRTKLITTLNTLKELREVFEKVGNFNSTEITTLKNAEYLIDEILSGETF